MEGPDVFPFLLIFREEVDCLGLVLDFAFFAVLLVCIIVAAKRGFVLSLMELVGFFLAGACALSLSGLIAPEIYDRFFAQQVTQQLPLGFRICRARQQPPSRRMPLLRACPM